MAGDAVLGARIVGFGLFRPKSPAQDPDDRHESCAEGEKAQRLENEQPDDGVGVNVG
jgi:hypothetical protein